MADKTLRSNPMVSRGSLMRGFKLPQHPHSTASNAHGKAPRQPAIDPWCHHRIKNGSHHRRKKWKTPPRTCPDAGTPPPLRRTVQECRTLDTASARTQEWSPWLCPIPQLPLACTSHGHGQAGEQAARQLGGQRSRRVPSPYVLCVAVVNAYELGCHCPQIVALPSWPRLIPMHMEAGAGGEAVRGTARLRRLRWG
jgi:hypothetical protein